MLHTLVIPANAPADNRVGVSSVLDPLFVNSCNISYQVSVLGYAESVEARTDLLELLVGGELDGAVGYDAHAVYTVAAHEPSEAFFAPHPGQRSRYAFVPRCAPLPLHLSAPVSFRLLQKRPNHKSSSLHSQYTSAYFHPPIMAETP